MKRSLDSLSFAMPPRACNAHLHIIDPAFPNDGKAEQQKGTVEEYRALSQKLALPRAIFVQAKPFALDNSCLLAAMEAFGRENSHGIAVVNNDITDKELERLHEGGVRGVRFSVWNPKNAVVSFSDCLPLSQRCRDFGWNMQLHMSAAQIEEQAAVLLKFPCRIVIDHMGRLDPHLGTKDPAYRFLLTLLDRGNVYIKLSGPYLNTAESYPWEDAAQTAAALAAYAPERMLWGSDFPHVTEKNKPAEKALLELIPQWLPSEKARFLALTENPETLYGF